MEPAAAQRVFEMQNFVLPSLEKIEGIPFRPFNHAMPAAPVLHRWANLCNNNDVIHVILIQGQGGLEYRIEDRQGTHQGGGTVTGTLQFLKSCEPVLEDDVIIFSKPVVDLKVMSEQVIRVRCLLGRIRAHWQTYHPVQDIRTTMPFVAEASPLCSAETQRVIHELTPYLHHHARLLPFFKCIQVLFGEKVILEPLSAPSEFDSGVKVTALRWGITLLTIAGSVVGGHPQVVVEGINDGFLADPPPGNYFRLFFDFTGSAIRIQFPRTLQWATRSKIHLVSAAQAQNMLRDVATAKLAPPNFNLRGSNAIGSDGGESPTTWSLKMLKVAGIDMGPSLWGGIMTFATSYTYSKAYYEAHPCNEQL